MHLLKQSTAASVLVGPVMDAAGATYAGMTIADFNLTKNGVSAAMAAAATATHDHNGHYVIAMTTGNTDTLGRAAISCNKATYAMSAARFEVLTAATFDAIVTNAAGAAGGLLTSDASNGAKLSVGTGAGQLNVASGKAPATVLNTDVAGNLTADIQTIKGQTVTCGAGVTVNVNVGTTQPVNFTGTAGSALVKTDAVDWGGTAVASAAVNANVTQWTGNAVATTNANGVPIVDVKYVLGNLAAFSDGTAQAGGASTITLAAGEPATTDYYKGRQITFVAGTAIGQSRWITAYNGSTKVATVHRAWDVNPDSTSQYSIDGLSEVRTDPAQALSAPRDVSAVADGSMTVNDALWGAVLGAAGRKDLVSTTVTLATPATHTTYRVSTVDSSSAPTFVH